MKCIFMNKSMTNTWLNWRRAIPESVYIHVGKKIVVFFSTVKNGKKTGALIGRRLSSHLRK